MKAPRWLRWLMVLLPRRHRQVVTDDLMEEHERLVHVGPGGTGPGRWLVREAVRAVLWGNLHRIRDAMSRRSRGVPTAGTRSGSLLKGGGGGMNGLDGLASDLRYAVRRLIKDPVFSLVAIGSLALGIGANTAVFSVVDAVLIKPLPYADADRLVRVGHAALDGSFGITAHTSANYVVWKETARSFESMAAYGFVSRSLTGRGRDAQLLQGVTSIGSIFDVLGVPAVRGRTFYEVDDGSGPEDVVVISHALWQDVFGGRDAIGRTLILGGKPYQVIGVMPPGFTFPAPGIQFWITSESETGQLATSLDWSYRTVARLAPGRTVEQAAQEMASIATRLREEHPETNRNITAQVVPLHELMVRNARPLLLVLAGTIGMVLVIACLNLANLLLSRGATRRREIAVRRAMGAGPARLLRLLLTESALVALLGGVAGLGVAWACLSGLVVWRPWNLPRLEEVGLDPAVIVFALLLVGVSALLFGGLPAITVAKISIDRRIGADVRGTARSATPRRLVVAQVAVSVVLLVGAGLLTRSFVSLTSVDPGFRSQNRLMFGLALPDTYPLGGRVSFLRELEDRLGTLPGVRNVGITTAVPIVNLGSSTRIQVLDSPVPEEERPEGAAYRVVSPDYFGAMGIELRRGRSLSHGDGQEGTPSVVVSEAMARAFWPGEPVLGNRVRIGLSPIAGRSGQQWLPPATVVGVVEDVHLLGLARQAPPTIYLVHEMVPYRGRFRVVLHADGDIGTLVSSVRGVVRDMDATLPVFGVSTLDDVVSASVAPSRTSMMMLGILGGVGLLTAMIGVYGVLSLQVSRRQREIGIRMALGADAADVRWGVVGTAMTALAWGLALGLAGSLYLTRFLKGLLFQVPPTDVVTITGIVLLLSLAAAVAAYLPAKRATVVDPVVVLKAE